MGVAEKGYIGIVFNSRVDEIIFAGFNGVLVTVAGKYLFAA